jgi:hypothetical protein
MNGEEQYGYTEQIPGEDRELFASIVGSSGFDSFAEVSRNKCDLEMFVDGAIKLRDLLRRIDARSLSRSQLLSLASKPSAWSAYLDLDAQSTDSSGHVSTVYLWECAEHGLAVREDGGTWLVELAGEDSQLVLATRGTDAAAPAAGEGPSEPEEIVGPSSALSEVKRPRGGTAWGGAPAMATGVGTDDAASPKGEQEDTSEEEDMEDEYAGGEYEEEEEQEEDEYEEDEEEDDEYEYDDEEEDEHEDEEDEEEDDETDDDGEEAAFDPSSADLDDLIALFHESIETFAADGVLLRSQLALFNEHVLQVTRQRERTIRLATAVIGGAELLARENEMLRSRLAGLEKMLSAERNVSALLAWEIAQHRGEG